MVEENSGEGKTNCNCPEAEASATHLRNRKEVDEARAKAERVEVPRSIRRLDQADSIKTMVKILSLNINL